MSTLDRDKPYGVVFGGYTEARYEQGGKLFDGAGQELKRGTSGETTGQPVTEPDPTVVEQAVAEAAPKKKASTKKAPAKGA